ncbi:MAG: hypothetical protein RLZ94_2635 [Actinomycetota bacterium]
MPTIVDEIRSKVVVAIRAEARVHQPQAGALEECLRSLETLRTPEDLWRHLRTSRIIDGNDGLIPANLGARLSHAIFLDVLSTEGLPLNEAVAGECFHRLALGSVGCLGVDWLDDIDVALGSLDAMTRAKHPLLSNHGAASALRAKLLGGHHDVLGDPLTALKRVVALGASWDNGQGLVGKRVNVAAEVGHGAAINVDSLSRAFDFVDRLRVHWSSSPADVSRLRTISKEIRERLLQVESQPFARAALQRISVLQAVELIAKRLSSASGVAIPGWGVDDDTMVLDPLGGQQEQYRLPTLFRLVTGSDVSLLTPEFRFRLHWSLCQPSFGLEQGHPTGHRLVNYPRATVPHHDERGVVSRLRFMMRVALSTAKDVGIAGLPERFAEQRAQQGPGDDAALAVLCRDPGLDPNVRQLVMQLPPGQRATLARRLIGIEIDTFKANLADKPDETAWIKEILDTLPQAARTEALTAELAAEGLIGAAQDSSRAAFFRRKLDRREPPRWEAVVLAGPEEFQAWLESNFHREFDQTDLVDLYQGVERLLEDQEPAERHKFERALEAISRFAALSAGAPAQCEGFFGGYGDAAALKAIVLNQVAPLGGALNLKPLHALVLEAQGVALAAGVLRELTVQQPAGHGDGERIHRVFRNPINEHDNLGRSRAVMIAMAAQVDVTIAALQPGAPLLEDPHRPSYGGVTPLMMAARRAVNGKREALESLGQYIRSLDAAGLEKRDMRGWRAVHHALKAGNTRAAQMLVAKGCSLALREGDGVSSLTAAFGAPSDKFEETVRWVVEQLQCAGQPGALTDDQVQDIVAFKYPAGAHRDSRGGRTNLLAAALRRPKFQQSLPWLESLAVQYPAAWNAPMVPNPTNPPADMVDPSLEDEVCRVMKEPAEFVVGLYNSTEHFRALVHNPSCARRVCRGLIETLDARNVDSVAAKFAVLIADGGVVDADHVDPLVGNVFHQLVARLRMLRAQGEQQPAPRAVYRLVEVMLRAADANRALLQRFPASDGADPVTKATRAGLHLVKFLFAQKLDAAPDDVSLASSFLADPGRFQADIETNHQLMRDGNGVVVLHHGVGLQCDLGMLEGAPSILVEAPFEPKQCEAFLRKAKIRIQRNLNTELIPAGEDQVDGSRILAIDLTAFTKWSAHQVRALS